MLPDITPRHVAALLPAAPPVTEEQIQEARDWAEGLLTRAGVTPEAGSAAERAAVRAIAYRAASLAVKNDVQDALAEAGTTVKVDKRFSVQVTAEAPQLLRQSAADYRADANTQLYAAGLPRPRRAMGASR